MATSQAVVRANGIDLHAMVEAIRAAGGWFVELLHHIEVTEGERLVPGLRWTVGDTAAHMLTILRRGTGDNRRADSRADLAQLNERCLAEVNTRAPDALADLVGDELQTLTELLDGLTDERASSTVIDLHAGIRTDIPSALSYILFDFLAHGYDIALASGRTWEIAPAHAALDLHACLPVFEPWVEASARAGPIQHLALSFPDDPTAIVLTVGNGTYEAQNHDREATDGVEEVDPIEIFLALAGRTRPTEPPVARLAEWFQPI